MKAVSTPNVVISLIKSVRSIQPLKCLEVFPVLLAQFWQALPFITINL